MAVNSAFHTNNIAALASEQNLYKNLVAEVIQIYGHDVHYIDRTLIAEDTMFGEDTLSKFRNSAKIEMYVENAGGGYAGEKELMSKFGLQDLSEITFVVAKHRFQELTKQFTIEDGTDTTGGSILIESGTIDNLDNAVVFEGSDFYLLNETDATDSDRPLEGDLVFHPIMKKLFQVNFVDHDQPFHQLDNNPVYKLQCRTFDYSSERLDTGISDIDAIEEALSVDTLNYQFTLEESTSGETLLLETEHWLIQEDYIVGDGVIDKTSQNELFDRLDDTVLDFTESNPFGDAGSLG
mgnify:FL=1|jgi:hypothetical protein|tara:strand:+ start:2019 stop:2900 length:882 start_codon:yes stop_codon:yes gene_type:complete